jgi:hypothetical protein
MLLTTAAILVAGGLVLWVLGTIFESQAFQMIGAILILGTGGALLNGAEVRSGQTVEKNYTTVNGTPVVANETVDVRTRPLGFSQQMSFGGLIMLAGGLGALRSLHTDTDA